MMRQFATYPVFRTAYVRDKEELEKNAGPVLVDPTGYVPMEVRVKNMFAAGASLEELRARQSLYGSDLYPEGTNPDDMEVDPTSRAGFDLVDASRLAAANGYRMKNAADKAAAEKAASAEKAAKEADEVRINALVEERMKLPEK